MSDGKHDPLDQALAGLPREVKPERDLWPEIESRIKQLGDLDVPPSSGAPDRSTGWAAGNLWRLAATVLVIAGVSILAFVMTRQNPSQPPQQIAEEQVPAPALNIQPASFGSEHLGAQYVAARAELDRLFEERVATLAPETRDKLMASLNDMRKATQELSDILAEHPSDPLLQQLLLSAYQNELKLLADVTDMTTPSTRVDL